MNASRRFIVRCQADQQIVLENVRTREQARVDGLAAIGEQIGRWLEHPGAPSAGETAPPVRTEA